MWIRVGRKSSIFVDVASIRHPLSTNAERKCIYTFLFFIFFSFSSSLLAGCTHSNGEALRRVIIETIFFPFADTKDWLDWTCVHTHKLLARKKQIEEIL